MAPVVCLVVERTVVVELLLLHGEEHLVCLGGHLTIVEEVIDIGEEQLD